MTATASRRTKRKKSDAPVVAAEHDGADANAEAREEAGAVTLEAVPDPEPTSVDGEEASASEPVAEQTPAIQTGEHPVPQQGEGSAASDAPDAPDTPDTPDAAAAAPEIDRAALKCVLESLLFVAESTISAVQLGRAVKVKSALVRELLAELVIEYEPRGIALVEVAGGYQFRSAARNADYVRDFVAQRPVRLTRAQLETLALIAYRQPITRPEIDDVRGVDSGSAMRVLLDRELIKMLGRKDEPGRPLLYGTTPNFLEFFGMRTLKDLPTLREFTELNDENRALFKRKTGEDVGEVEAALADAEESARHDDEPVGHISDEDLAELAAQADAEEAEARGEGGESEPAPDGAHASGLVGDDDPPEDFPADEDGPA